MIHIHNDGPISQIQLLILRSSLNEIFKMVIWNIFSSSINSSSQYGMGVWVASGFYFPAIIDKGMFTLGSNKGVKHDGNISTSVIFHTNREIDATNCQAMLLIFYGTSSNGYIT